MYNGLRIKYLLFLSDLNFLDRLSKNSRISNFMKISLLGAELFHVGLWMDRKTGVTKLMPAFCNYTYVPKTLKPCLWGGERAVNYLQIFIFHGGFGHNSSEEHSLSIFFFV
jgi:hypothetical protein